MHASRLHPVALAIVALVGLAAVSLVRAQSSVRSITLLGLAAVKEACCMSVQSLQVVIEPRL